MKFLERIRHKFVRDALTLQVGAMFNAVGNFVSAALLAHLLGAEVQGKFYVATSLYSLLWFLVNQGLMQATVSQVAAANSRNQPDKVAGWTAWLVKASVVFGLVLAGLGFLTLPFLAEHVLDTDRRVGWWAAWMALSPLLETPRVVACAAMQGTRRMLPFAQTENAQEAIRVFLVIIGALITNSAVGPVIGTLAASALGSVVATELYRRDRRHADSPLPSFAAIRKFVFVAPLLYGARLGVKLGIVRNLNALCMEVVPSLLIERFGSSEWVAYMRIAQRLMRVPLMFMQGISRTALPMFSERAALKDIAGLRRAFFKASVVSGLVITLGIAVVLPFLPWILRLAFPATYSDPVLTVCLILVPGFIVMSFSIANDTFYLVTNTLRVAVTISVVGMCISVVMLVLLARWNPTTGVAWGLTINMACSSLHLVYAAWYFRKHARESLPPGTAVARVPAAAAEDAPVAEG
ncbi:MAG: oligosaccharide flippase family protein [Planctomycetes bacterium]|nr:oligosaccharide flippase family protein [Planctomycetota bacterium]